MSLEIIIYEKNLLSELSTLGELRCALSNSVIPYSAFLKNKVKTQNLPKNVVKPILMEEIKNAN